jgi:hypothetical protein
MKISTFQQDSITDSSIPLRWQYVIQKVIGTDVESFNIDSIQYNFNDTEEEDRIEKSQPPPFTAPTKTLFFKSVNNFLTTLDSSVINSIG